MQAGEYNYIQNNTEPTQYEDDVVYPASSNGNLPFNVGCQNTASQIQGAENAVSQAAEQVVP